MKLLKNKNKRDESCWTSNQRKGGGGNKIRQNKVMDFHGLKHNIQALPYLLHNEQVELSIFDGL